MKVASEVPLPKPRATGITKTLRGMDPGQSVLVDTIVIPSWRAAAHQAGLGIITKACETQKGKHRIWKK